MEAEGPHAGKGVHNSEGPTLRSKWAHRGKGAQRRTLSMVAVFFSLALIPCSPTFKCSRCSILVLLQIQLAIP